MNFDHYFNILVSTALANEMRLVDTIHKGMTAPYQLYDG